MQLLRKPRRISISTFEPNNILRVQAQSNYCKIYFIDGCKTVVISKVLNLVQQKLPPEMFIRVHKSHLINRQYIKQVSGTHTKTAELVNGESFVFSRRRKAMFYKTYDFQAYSNTQSAS
jgi:two-component system LytT family response regulator